MKGEAQRLALQDELKSRMTKKKKKNQCGCMLTIPWIIGRVLA